MDSDTTMALAAVGLAAAGLAVLIVVRKKRRQKEMDHVMNDTQVGT
jgi:LPXTG-motif cell wall-anchored protein